MHISTNPLLCYVEIERMPQVMADVSLPGIELAGKEKKKGEKPACVTALLPSIAIVSPWAADHTTSSSVSGQARRISRDRRWSSKRARFMAIASVGPLLFSADIFRSSSASRILTLE